MGDPIAEAIGPFLRELRSIRHLMKWTIDSRGRIRGLHAEYLTTFSPIEAVAWAASGLRFADLEAGQFLKIEKVSTEIVEASNKRMLNGKTRIAILQATGILREA